MPKNWIFAANILWPVLIEAAATRRTLYYSDVAPTISTIPLQVGHALGPIQAYCLEMRLPPLTSIVISRDTGVPGGGFIAWDVGDLQSGQEQVYKYPWSQIINPFENFQESDTIESLAKRLVDDPVNAVDVYRKVPDRGVAQQIFRRALCEAYEWRCAFCQTTFSQALDAAHIKPWSQASLNQRMDVRNGLLLCAVHHRLFDDQSLIVDENYVIDYFDPDERAGLYGRSDSFIGTALHGTEIALPDDEKLWPSIGLLGEHASKRKK